MKRQCEVMKKLKTTLTSLLAISVLSLSSARAQLTGNALTIKIDSDPTTLNVITSADAYASEVQGYIFDSLMTRDENTYAWLPALAEKYEISKDGKTFTFKIREGVQWHDGKPLTIEDVKYSFDCYFDGRWQAPHVAVYLEGIKEAKIIDQRTIQFTAKETYFKNFDVVAGLTIVPKHFYTAGSKDDPKFNRELIGTSAYTLAEWSRGQKIVLKKNPNFWGRNLPYFKERYKFDRIVFRPVKEEAVAFEMLKKGDLDFLTLTPEQYVTKTKTPEFGKTVLAVKAENSEPDNFSYGYIGWNGKHPFFSDANVRMAMSLLLNRDFMIEKFRYGMSEKGVGPFGNRSSASSKNVKPVPYDPKKALTLLEKSGWKIGPKGMTKVIEGQEKSFEFTLLSANPDAEKYFTVFKEDLKKLGITLNIKFLEWNSFIKLVDERKFDAMSMSWQVNSLEPDPKQIWHSSAIAPPGHNFVSYSNPKVDKLIDEMRVNMNANARKKMLNQIHEMIAADQPYSFLFNRKFVLYGASARVQRPKDTLKYNVGMSTWSIGK